MGCCNIERCGIDFFYQGSARAGAERGRSGKTQLRGAFPSRADNRRGYYPGPGAVPDCYRPRLRGAEAASHRGDLWADYRDRDDESGGAHVVPLFRPTT